MKEYTINIEGESLGDIEIAIETVLSLVKEGYMSGMDSNESSSYSFESSGEFGEEDE